MIGSDHHALDDGHGSDEHGMMATVTHNPLKCEKVFVDRSVNVCLNVCLNVCFQLKMPN